MSHSKALFAFALVACLALRDSAAAEGAYQISADCAAAGCFAGDFPGSPVTIAASGRYVLTSDLSVPIQIATTATAIDLDLGGHSIDGGNRCSGNPVTTSCALANGNDGITTAAQAAGTWYRLRIHDGAVRGFDTDLQLNSLGTGSSLENLTISDSSNSLGAIYIDKTEPGAYLTLRGLRVVHNRGTGYQEQTNPGGTLWQTTIEDSTFAGNGNCGASVYGGAVIRNSRFLENANYGLFCTGNNGAPGTASVFQNTFIGNKAGTANAEYSCGLIASANYCADGTCP